MLAYVGDNKDYQKLPQLELCLEGYAERYRAAPPNERYRCESAAMVSCTTLVAGT